MSNLNKISKQTEFLATVRANLQSLGSKSVSELQITKQIKSSRCAVEKTLKQLIETYNIYPIKRTGKKGQQQQKKILL